MSSPASEPSPSPHPCAEHPDEHADGLRAHQPLAVPVARPPAGRGSLLRRLLLLSLLAGVLFWQQQRWQLLDARLVATQESFARLSEEAAGRLAAVSGQLSEAESSVSTEREALRQRQRLLEERLSRLQDSHAALLAQQLEESQRLQALQTQLDAQREVATRLAEALARAQDARQALEARLQQQQAAQAALSEQLAGLQGEVQRLTVQQAEQGDVAAQLRQLASEQRTLARQMAAQPSVAAALAALERLEGEWLVLRSQLERERAAGEPVSLREFDAFRRQLSREVGELQQRLRAAGTAR